MFPLPGSYTYQPQFAADIDRSSPYTQGLLLANTPQHGLRNAVEGYPNLAVTGATSWVNGQAGLGHGGMSTSGNYLTWVPPTGLTAGTVLVVTDRSTAGVADGPWAIGSSAIEDLYPYIDDNIYMGAWANARYVSGVAVPGGVSTLLKPNVLIAVGSTTASTHACYKDGALIGSANATFAYAATFKFGNSTGSVYRGKFYLIAVWNRILSKREIAELSLNPWQIFSGGYDFLFPSVPAGGVSVTLSGQLLGSSQGSLSYSNSVSLTGTSSNSSQGSIGYGITSSLSGQVASTSQGSFTYGLSTTLTSILSSVSQGTLSPSIGLSLVGQQLGIGVGNISYVTAGGYPPTNTVLLGTVYGASGEFVGTLDAVDKSLKYDLTTGMLVKPLSNKTVISI